MQSVAPVDPRGKLLSSQIDNALAEDNPASVSSLVHELLSRPYPSADTLLHTGVSLAQRDSYSDAKAVFARCVKDYPQMFAGYYDLALTELTLRDYSNALAILAHAPPTSTSGELNRIYLSGKIESSLGQNAEAERDLSAAFDADPREENFALDLGLYYLRVQKYQKALAVYQRATTFQRNSLYFQLGLSLAQFLGGQEAEAIETCRAILSIQPDFSPARVMMAFALYMQGKVDEAVKISAQGLNDPNPFPYLYYMHAVSLLRVQSEDTDLMLSELHRAIQGIPECSLCYLAMSKVHQGKGERQIARVDLEIAVGIDPTFAEAWYRLAGLYDQAGESAAAEQARRRFEELKENKANRETEMLRSLFLETLDGEPAPAK